MANKRKGPRGVPGFTVKHDIPEGHEVVLPKNALFRVFERELLERFASKPTQKADPHDGE